MPFDFLELLLPFFFVAMALLPTFDAPSPYPPNGGALDMNIA